MRQLSHTAILLFAALLLVGCEDMPYMHVQGGSAPRFLFHGSQVSYLIVYRPPPEYINGIPPEVLDKDLRNRQWLIEGEHEAKIPIEYGVVPPGMKETTPAKRLVEGVVYAVIAYMGSGDIGAHAGRNFIISNGAAVEINDFIDRNTLSPAQSN